MPGQTPDKPPDAVDVVDGPINPRQCLASKLAVS